MARHAHPAFRWAFTAAALLLGSLTAQFPSSALADQGEQPLPRGSSNVSVGGAHTCVILGTGAVRCWGLNYFPTGGQLGLGHTETIGDDETPVVDVDLGGATATAISAGAYHTCALLTGGAVRCWGNNLNGQLGLGNNETIGDDESPTTDVDLGVAAVAISAGRYHTCAVLRGGAVRCWGYGFDGQLGLDDHENIGDDERPTTNVDLGGATAVAVSAGAEHTCAILTGGVVRCWGETQAGRLVRGSSLSGAHTESPTSDVDLGGATAVAISASFYHTCVILTGGAVRCWGSGGYGQLGLGNNDIVDPPTMDVDLGGASATAVSTGTWGTCVALADGAVRCWGWSYTGQLGLGTIDIVGDDEVPTVDVDLGPGGYATTVTSGSDSSCALLIVGALRCWGENSFGALGLGHTEAIGDDEVPTVNTDLGAGVTVGPDRMRPTVTIATPRPRQSLPAKAVMSGTASDNVSVTSVEVTIYRRDQGGQYWNGKDWQSAEVSVTADLASPMSPTTTWTYSLATTARGSFGLVATATDSSDNVGVTNRQTFSI